MGTQIAAKKACFTQHIFILLFCFSISTPSLANQSDWGLVDRFNKQLSAATSGKVSSMYDVAKLYERGRGVEKNLGKAAQWYKKAADAGDAEAKSRLGIMYFEGRGVVKNHKKALMLLNSAVKKNIPSAQNQLANMYELGAGVPQNLKRAIHWYRQSKKNGYYLAEGKIASLQKQLSSANAVAVKRPTHKAKSSKSQKKSSSILSTITSGHWFKGKKPVGYLPSNITNCVDNSYNSLKCISTSQERSTGTEIVTYNTESKITIKNRQSFNVSYANTVLNVTPLNVEDGDGNIIAKTPSRIKKGKQGRHRTITCELKSANTILCKKGSSSFNLVTR